VDADGAVVIRKRISRAKVLEFFAAVPPCLVGIEACPSAHHWSRKLQQRRARRRGVQSLAQAYVFNVFGWLAEAARG
jgi:transposase